MTTFKEAKPPIKAGQAVMHPDDYPLAVLRMACAEIRRGRYTGRYLFGEWHGYPSLFLKHTEVIPHLRQSRAMKGQWKHYRTVTALQLKRALIAHGLLLSECTERAIEGRRTGHLLAIDLARLATVGIHF